MPMIEAKDGTQLYCNDWGSGPPVVLVHGWPLTSDMWEYQSVFLARQGLRVVTYDRRGFGRSSQPWEGYDYDTMADDLAAVMDARDVHGATLVGFSMGGGEVVRYLSRHGAGRVAKAALVSSVTPFMLKTADNPDGVDRSVFDEIVEGLEKDRPGFLASFGKKFFGVGMLSSPVSAEMLQWTLMMAMQGSPKATLDCVRAFSGTDLRADVRALTVPTLVVHGTSDTTVPPDVSGRAVAAMLPRARLLEYEGAPHGLFYTERERLNADLLDFVRG